MHLKKRFMYSCEPPGVKKSSLKEKRSGLIWFLSNHLIEENIENFKIAW